MCEELKTLKDFRKLQPALLAWDMLRKETIRWIKKIRSMNYGEKLCLNCMKVYGGGNNGSQYCCRGLDHDLRFLEQQTGSSIGAVEVLMKFYNIREKHLK